MSVQQAGSSPNPNLIEQTGGIEAGQVASGTEQTAASSQAEAAVSREPSTCGPVLDQASAMLLNQLESIEGSGPKLLRGLDKEKDLYRAMSNLISERSASNRINADDVKALIKKAKDFKSITKEEFAVLSNNVEAFSDLFDPTALKALQAFISKHAPEGTWGYERVTDRQTGETSSWRPSRPSWER